MAAGGAADHRRTGRRCRRRSRRRRNSGSFGGLHTPRWHGCHRWRRRRLRRNESRSHAGPDASHAPDGHFRRQPRDVRGSESVRHRREDSADDRPGLRLRSGARGLRVPGIGQPLRQGRNQGRRLSAIQGGRTMSRLEGKVALVTGASKGIGAGIAKGLAAAGASVAVNYASDRGGAEAVAAAITASGGRAIVVPGDVSRSADVARLFVETKAAYGALDVLVNNAAVYQFGPLEAMTEEEFHREFNTNVLGPLLMIREAVKYFGPRGGSIINIGSMASQLTPPNFSIYSATKSALDAITRVLAKELGPRQIRVNSINPGATATEGARAAGVIGVGSDYEKQILAMTPLGRIGQPSDIAPIAVFLASDESAWLTGELISASGGWR